MPTNFEFQKDDILKITSKNKRVAIKGEKIVECYDLGSCAQCYFHGGCEKNHFQWLYEEHIEAPKLTKRERAFCEAVQTGWIARDEDGKIHWYETEPENDEEEWLCDGLRFIDFTHFRLFDFIKWEDEKPWAVSSLLELEVQDDE